MSERAEIGARKLAVVTGGGRETPRTITLRLVKSGWRCLNAGLDREDLEEKAAVDGVPGEAIITHECDIATDAGRQSLTRLSEGVNEPLGLLDNCAARSSPIPLFQQSEATWRAELETNLIPVSLLSSWAISEMGESGGSVVINIGSVYGSLDLNSKYYRGICPQGGSDGPPRSPAYHASKGGLAALTREFAVLSGQWNIRVNTISSGVSKNTGTAGDPGANRAIL